MLSDRIAELERQLEEARKQMEAQKNEWLSWEAKRKTFEEDANMLNWLDQNIFHREPDDFDLKYGRCSTGIVTNWQIYAPKGVHGSARAIIAAAMKGTP